jgi:hypothetical protein
MEEENTMVDIPVQEIDIVVSLGSSCIVRKLLGDQIVGKEIIKNPLIRAWRPTSWVTLNDLGPNMFLIEFEHSWDKSKIMKGRDKSQILYIWTP